MYDIIKDEEINISKKLWSELNDKHDKNYIKQLISDTIEDNNLELPYRKITLKDAEEDFDKLCKFDATSLFETGSFQTRYDYKYPFSNKYINMSNIGNKASDYFQQENRFRCDSINAPSPYRTWTTEKFRLTLLNALWTLKFEKINNDVLRSAISLRKYIASQFKPSVAKCIYQTYKAETVLDFSSGWGDRLAGFCATDGTKKYVGVDPNPSVHSGYKKQIELYNTDKQIELIESPAEDISSYNDEFDLIFTSPPYFDVERYTRDDNQSWRRYKKFNNWLENFLFETLENSWSHLKVNGHMIINISDVYCHHTVNEICDPMNDFISSLKGAKHMGTLGMRMAKRPNSKAMKSGIFAEPVWIWKKAS